MARSTTTTVATTTSRLRRVVAGGAAAAALGVGALTVGTLDPLGVASAQEDEAPAGDEAVEGPFDRGPGPLQRVLDRLVEDGTLTPDQATAVSEGVEAEFAERGPREGRFGDRGPGRGPIHRLLHGTIEVAADTIGLETDELQAALADGQSLAEVAEANGVEREALVDALVGAAEAAIDEKAPDAVDPDRLAGLKERLPDLVERLVDRSR